MRTLHAGRSGLHLEQLPTEPLIKALPMVVGHELLDDVPKMALTEKDEVIQTLVFDGLHEPLRVGIAVRASRRDLQALHPSHSQDCFERFREQRIPVVDQVGRTLEGTLNTRFSLADLA